MKKTVFATLIVALLAVAVVIPVAAQAPVPQSPGFGPAGYGYNVDGETYPMRETMIAAFATELGLTVEEVEAAIAEGKSVYDLAAENGISEENFYSIMLAARQASLDIGVAQGTFTQERADWMSQRQTNMQTGEFETCLDGPGDGAANTSRGNRMANGRNNQ
jgi:hypothetical protein